MPSKKKICIVCEYPPPLGGIPNQGVLLTERLKSEGYQINTCDVNIKIPFPLSYISKSIIVKIFIKIPMVLYRLLINIIKSDIVHIFSICGLYFYVIVTPAVVLSKIFSKKIIINYHAGYFSEFYQHSIKLLVKYIMRSADLVVTPLGYLKNEFAIVGCTIKEVSNIVDMECYNYKKRVSFKPSFITTRHLREVYGNDIVIKAFAEIVNRYPHAILTVAGDGDEYSRLIELTKKMKVYEKVKFTGYVNKEKLIKLYEESDIFLNGSRRDNMPLSILEAFMAGLPVVSTNPMGIPFLVKHGESGLLADVNDYHGIAEHALKILDNASEGQRLAQNAYSFVKTLNWNHLKHKYFDLYD
jgi:glycosyltransferase involved in cell wall biosynthesis